MRLKEIIKTLEDLAPPILQEGYDNSGLIVGNPDMEISGVVVCLDSVEAVIDDAIEKGANLVVAHHPIVFGGLKSLTGKNYIERTVIKAIQHNIAIYAIHTNLDNVKIGVNRKICDKIGLSKLRILSPKKGLLSKLVVFIPQDHKSQVMNAMFGAGAGTIGNYDECSFGLNGVGTFKGNSESDPYSGTPGVRSEEEEARIEFLVENHLLAKVLKAMFETHPYEEVAHDIYPLSNKNQDTGSGMIGELNEPMVYDKFLNMIKDRFNLNCVRYTKPIKNEVLKVAVCGGSGSFLLDDAIRAGADIFISADFKYHQFFDADGRIQIADIGHYESEQFTIDLLVEYLSRKFPKFAVHFTKVNTNPINYC